MPLFEKAPCVKFYLVKYEFLETMLNFKKNGCGTARLLARAGMGVVQLRMLLARAVMGVVQLRMLLARVGIVFYVVDDSNLNGNII